MRLNTALGAAAAMLLTVAAAAQQRSIEHLAPGRTIMLAGTSDLDQAMNHMRANPLWEMLHSDEMKPFTDEAFERIREIKGRIEDELQLEEGDFALPSGAVGVALFLAPNEDLGFDTLGMMAVVDFRGRQDLVERGFDTMIDRMREQGAEIDEFELDGRQYYGFDMNNDGDVDDEDFDDFDDFDEDFPMMFDPEELVGPFTMGMDRMFISRAGETILMGTNLRVLGDAFSALEGHELDVVADHPAFQEAVAQAGRGDFHAVVLLENVGRTMQMHPMMMFAGPMVGGPLKATGLDSLKAVAMSVDFSRDDLAMRQTMAILVDGPKRGLVALADHSMAITDAPAWVRGHSGYTRLNLRFDEIMNLVNDILRSLPAEAAGMADEFMFEYGPDLQDLFASLGPDVHLINASETMFAGVRLRTADRFENLLSKYAPMMQLEPREFAGHTIFSSPFAPMAIGIGAGFVFIGESTTVEDALRVAGDAGGAFAGDPQFAAARAMIGQSPVVAWGYTDTAATVDAARAQWREQGLGGRQADMLDPAFIKRYIGPSIWTMRSTDRGFVMESFTLRPVDGN